MNNRSLEIQELINRIAVLRERLKMVDVIRSYAEVSDDSSAARSPFVERDDSFSLVFNEDTKAFYCFASEQGGDAVKFVQLVEGVDVTQAVAILEKRFPAVKDDQTSREVENS